MWLFWILLRNGQVGERLGQFAVFDFGIRPRLSLKSKSRLNKATLASKGNNLI